MIARSIFRLDGSGKKKNIKNQTFSKKTIQKFTAVCCNTCLLSIKTLKMYVSSETVNSTIFILCSIVYPLP